MLMHSIESFEKRWVDDYLDLLNYAKLIGDTAWQHEIVSMLNDSERRKGQAALELRTEALWQQFDAVNAKMLELYRQLRETGNAYNSVKITEEVWALKMQRVEIGRQLHTVSQSML